MKLKIKRNIDIILNLAAESLKSDFHKSACTIQ